MPTFLFIIILHYSATIDYFNGECKEDQPAYLFILHIFALHFPLSYYVFLSAKSLTQCQLHFSRAIRTFLRPCLKILLKTLCEKGKMLVTSIFYFGNNGFTLSKTGIIILAKIKVVCKCFQFT